MKKSFGVGNNTGVYLQSQSSKSKIESFFFFFLGVGRRLIKGLKISTCDLLSEITFSGVQISQQGFGTVMNFQFYCSCTHGEIEIELYNGRQE